MNFGELKTKSVKDLKEVCKNDRSKYRGYSYHTRKDDLITFIIRQNTDINPPSTPEVISDLSTFFETGEELEERYTEMYMERPHDSEIQDLVSSLKATYAQSDVIFDNHNDPNNDIIYKGNKGKYISQYNSLGENGEMILYHGTNGENLMGILSDDFRLTSNPVHGSLFGRGIYFTNDIVKALHYSEKGKTTKYVIVCVVHIGDIVKGNQNMHIHPLMPNSDKRYDTSVDNISEPKQFIKKKNGTYNILGIITIENYKLTNNHVNRQSGFNGSFSIRNTRDNEIILYWVPDHCIHLLPYINFSLCKRLTKVKSRWTSTHGMATAIYSSGTQLCNIGHTFICVIEAQRPTVKRPRNVSGTRPGHYNIVKIFKSTRKGEVINV